MSHRWNHTGRCAASAAIRRGISILTLFLLTLTAPLRVQAQLMDRIMERVDTLLEVINSTPRDSVYLEKPAQKWTIRALTNVGNSSVFLHDIPLEYEGTFSTHMKGKVRHTLTLSANYRGLSAAVSFNPAMLLGRKSSLQLNLTAYGNHYGVEVHYENENKLSGKGSGVGQHWNIESGFSQNTFTVSGYWAFNYRRFSYPAAFTQSWIQKRSAGSVLLGATFNSSHLMVDEQDWDALNVRSAEVKTLTFGAGYAYNFVPRKRWLIHGSLIPMLMLWNEKVIHGTTYGRVLSTNFPEYSVRGTLAVVRYYDRFFLGGNLLYVYTYSKLEQGMSMVVGRWRVRALVGVRF